MNEQAIINDAAGFAKDILSREGSGHDWWHTHRVWQLAKHIAEKERIEDVTAVELAAILHELVDPKTVSFTKISEKDIEERLRSYGLDEVRIGKVMTGIQDTSFSRTIGQEGKFGENLPIEAKIISDADKLDAIGAIGIARVFTYGGAKGHAIHDPNSKPREYKSREEYHAAYKTSINHFYEKLLLLKDMMFTATAKKLAEQRHAYMEQFLKEFYAEWDGKR
jgi:Predicted HD superfamily hydrolase